MEVNWGRLIGRKFIKFQIRRLDIFEGVHICNLLNDFCFFQKDLPGKKMKKKILTLIPIRITLSDQEYFARKLVYCIGLALQSNPLGHTYMISKSIQCFCDGIGVRLDHIDLSHPIHLPVDYEYMQRVMS